MEKKNKKSLTMIAVFVLFALTILGSTRAFVPIKQCKWSSSRRAQNADNAGADASGKLDVDLDELSKESAAAAAFKTTVDLSEMTVKPESRKAPRQAGWLPLLLSPEALDGTMAGDVGFDPLGFSRTKQDLNRMREAEIKHARLAMLGAAGWPMSEIWHRELADSFGLESILADGDRAPSVLNGGLSNEWIIAAGVFSLVVGGLLEAKSFEASKRAGYKPGDYNFDPLRLYSIRSSFALEKISENLTREQKIAAAKFDMELCEIRNGRLAMIAMLANAAQEFVLGTPIVQQTPFFFGNPMI